eukprot:COSAG06_NODE_1109_length_10653_cov_103.721148_5_plen_84_part_00
MSTLLIPSAQEDFAARRGAENAGSGEDLEQLISDGTTLILFRMLCLVLSCMFLSCLVFYVLVLSCLILSYRRFVSAFESFLQA